MAEPIELSKEPLQEPVVSYDTAISCLARLSGPGGGAARSEAARRSLDLAGETIPLSRLVKLAAEFGLQAEGVRLDWRGLKKAVSANPLLIVRNNTDVVVITGGGRSGAEEVSVWDPHHDGVVFFVSRGDFERRWSGYALVITAEDAGATIFDASPRSPDMPNQQTPPRRSRRSLRLSLGVAAAAIVASAGMALFLLTSPSADQVTGPSIQTRVDTAAAQNTLANPKEAAPSAGQDDLNPNHEDR